MSTNGPRLALGTVQFGLGYGIAGRDQPVAEQEVRRILESAAAAGVQGVDTAPAYGDIEQRLATLGAGLDLRFVSKIPALPSGIGSADAAACFALQSAQTSHGRLGSALDALLFHRAEDLLAPEGEAVWRALEGFSEREGVRLGVSCYDVAVLGRLCSRFPIAVAQMPGNVFDQGVGVALSGDVDKVEIHLRSVFLQGLLLLNEHEAVKRLPAAATPLRRWHAWLAERRLDALTAALAIAKGFRHVHRCVVGVDSLSHFESVLASWRAAAPLSAPELACTAPVVIDPRRWRENA